MTFWQALIRVPLVLMLMACLYGCVPMPPQTIQTMIPKEDLSFLEKGQTTKDEVRASLGIPQQTNETDSEWVYELRTVLSGRWGYCVAIPPGYGGCGVSDGEVALRLLRIDFNDSGVVTSWDEYKSVAENVEDSIVTVYDSLEERDGLLFRPPSTTPFSGMHSWFHDNGQLAGLVSITDGVRDGEFATWHSDGRKDAEQYYQSGQLNGRSITWYKNGQKYTQDHYKDNQLHGLSTYWNPDGTVSFQMCFQNGEYSDMTPENCMP
jgi:outer membrane protein assembly factor BamE (lipoprotein component of BamABCDE complex)